MLTIRRSVASRSLSQAPSLSFEKGALTSAVQFLPSLFQKKNRQYHGRMEIISIDWLRYVITRLPRMRYFLRCVFTYISATVDIFPAPD